MDQAALKTRKIDRFSLLPPELIDHIFELVTRTHQLPAVPPSRQLLPSYERALYRSIILRRQSQLSALIANLEINQRKGLLIKFVEFQHGHRHGQKLDTLLMNKLLSTLENLQSLTVQFWINDWPPGESLRIYTQLEKLHTLRLPGMIASLAFVRDISRFPNLRKVELGSVSRDTGGYFTPASQVTEIYLMQDWTRNIYAGPVDISSLLRSFPSAKIVSIEICDILRGDQDDWSSYFLTLRASLRILRLFDWEGPPKFPISLPQLSDFTALRHLQLDQHYTFDLTHLLSLRYLVTLDIAVDHFDRELVKLFKGPLRLPHLRHVDFSYLPIDTGYSFDFIEIEHRINDIYSGEGMNTHGFNQMWDWKLPFGSRVSEGLQLVQEVEATAREAGVIVKSNLDQFKTSFQFQLVEFYNRGVGEAWFHKDTAPLQEALELAQNHDIGLPSLEIDLEEEIDPDIHECFEVLVVVESHGRRIKRPAYGIREKIYKEDISEEEESEDEMERRAEEEEEEEDWEDGESSAEKDDESD